MAFFQSPEPSASQFQLKILRFRRLAHDNTRVFRLAAHHVRRIRREGIAPAGKYFELRCIGCPRFELRLTPRIENILAQNPNCLTVIDNFALVSGDEKSCPSRTRDGCAVLNLGAPLSGLRTERLVLLRPHHVHLVEVRECRFKIPDFDTLSLTDPNGVGRCTLEQG
jgi:hypothetical protein